MIEPSTYLKVELYLPSEDALVLGRGLLGTHRLGPRPRWADVTCNVLDINVRAGGREEALSSAISAGYLHFRTRNALNPLENLAVHPGVEIRVRDTRLPAAEAQLWYGRLDDIAVTYDKTTSDYIVTLSATDSVRALKAQTLRGMPPESAIADFRTTTPDRIVEIADRTGLSSIVGGAQGTFARTTFPPSTWRRWGTAPSGITTPALSVDSSWCRTNDEFATTGDISVDYFSYGLEAPLTGLIPGARYVVSSQITMSGYTHPPEDFGRFMLQADTGDTGIAFPFIFNGRPRGGRVEVGFTATATTHTVRVGRDYEGTFEAPSYGSRLQAGYTLTPIRVDRWTGDDTIYPLQPVAYQSSAFNHLTMACNSGGYLWAIDTAGRIAALPDSTNLPLAATFSDEHSADPLHVCYTALDYGYDTAESINALEITNRGRTRSTEDSSGWVIADTLTDHEDNASLRRYGIRRGALDLQMYSGHLAERAADLFARHSTPQQIARSVTINATEHDVKLPLLSQVEITFRGSTRRYWITGAEHSITPTKHTTTYQVRPA